MTLAVSQREFKPGTTGWSVDDLDDPDIERQWEDGRYEIVEGVLTLMAAACFDGGLALKRVVRAVENHTVANGLGDGFAFTVDLILGKYRLPKVDAIYLSPDDRIRQKAAHAATKKRKHLMYGRILVVPTLVLESISEGHEAHDRVTKRAWYAERGIPNYWILDSLKRSLECLKLQNAQYVVDVEGSDSSIVQPSFFPGLSLDLGKIWAD